MSTADTNKPVSSGIGAHLGPILVIRIGLVLSIEQRLAHLSGQVVALVPNGAVGEISIASGTKLAVACERTVDPRKHVLKQVLIAQSGLLIHHIGGVWIHEVLRLTRVVLSKLA